MLEKLSNSLKDSLRKILKASLIDKKLVEELTSDIKKALISGDVNISLADQISETIKERALKEKPPKGLPAREHTINIVYDELTKFLGSDPGKIEIKKEKGQPFKILLVGLFGSGKTTTTGKLAKYYKKQGYKVALIQTDTWRPAAYEQLKQLASQVNVPFFGEKDEKDPIKILEKYKSEFEKFDIIICDSAGRDALNQELIEEIKKINLLFNPNEKLLVLSGDIGQAARDQAQKFHDTVKVSGVILTKLEGTAKGGGALSACSATDAKVKFIGIGEKLDNLEEFKPKNFVSRLLGMGDLETLLKKAETAIEKEDAEKMKKKITTGSLSLQDLYEQMEAMKKIGPLTQIANMIPGMGMAKLPKGIFEQQEGKMNNWKYLMDSMTQEEKDNPDIINSSRINRIAKGSGRDPSELRELLSQYKQMKKMMKMFGNKRKMKQLEKMFGKGGFPGGMNFPGM